jgi:hypothetical protein
LLPGIADCLHCGVRVHFGEDGACPSCRVPRDAPVTSRDFERIEEIRGDARRRTAHVPAQAERRLQLGIGAAVFLVALAVPLVTLLATDDPRGRMTLVLPVGALMVGVKLMLHA